MSNNDSRHSSFGSRRAFRYTSSVGINESRHIPSPPSILNQRGYYSDLVNEDANGLVDTVSTFRADPGSIWYMIRTCLIY